MIKKKSQNPLQFVQVISVLLSMFTNMCSYVKKKKLSIIYPVGVHGKPVGCANCGNGSQLRIPQKTRLVNVIMNIKTPGASWDRSGSPWVTSLKADGW